MLTLDKDTRANPSPYKKNAVGSLIHRNQLKLQFLGFHLKDRETDPPDFYLLLKNEVVG